MSNQSNRNNLRAEFDRVLSFSDDWTPTDYTDCAVTDSARILIASDVHAPKFDAALMSSMLEFAHNERIDTILWLGDLLDCEEFSSFGIDDPTSNHNRNCRMVGKLIKQAANYFPTQIWSGGNHEFRVDRATKGILNLESLALQCGLSELMDEGKVIVNDHPTVLGSVGNWMFTHPGQFGLPGVTPSKLATRYQKNVLTAHEHSLAIGRCESDKFWTVNCGGLFDPRLHKYINKKVTSHRSWVRGFATVINGVPAIHHRSEFVA